MMMLTLYEFIHWTGMTVFELWMHFLAIFITTILLTLKIYLFPSMSYWNVCTPLFIASAFDAYFLFIVFVRSVVEYHDCRNPLCRFVCNLLRLLLMVAFETLLCYKIEGDFEQGQVATGYSYGIVFMPVWLLFTALSFQTCRLF